MYIDVPEEPKDLTNKIRMIVEESGSGSNVQQSAVASIDWNPPDDNNTITVRYNLSLSKMASEEDKTSYFSLYDSAFIQVLEEGNYTVNISVTDICGQESEPAMLKFEVNTTKLNSCRCFQFWIPLGVAIAVIVILSGAILVCITIIVCCLKKK